MPVVALREFEVEWGHCDPAGIVWNPRYFEWFDHCTAGLFARVGLAKHEMVARFDIVGIPLVETKAKFHAPSKWGDRIRVESRIAEFRTSSFDVEHRVFNGDRLAVESNETRVWVGRHPDDPAKLKSRPIPAEVLALFEKN